MSRTSFHGTFWTGDSGAVLDVLRAWLRNDALDKKVRMSGIEIVHEGPGIYVFCQEAPVGLGRQPYYQIEGTVDATPDAGAERLRPLLELSRDKGVEFSLEYVPIDDNGTEIGDEISLE
jgi:hypothetical protein